MEYRDILDELYRRYYESSEFSGVASCHWKKYGSLTKVTRKGRRYLLSGVGFGNFISSNVLKSLKYLLLSRRSFFLLHKFYVNHRIAASGFQVARKSGRQVDFDCIKQILSVDLLQKNNILDSVKTVVVIGDGYGYMTALIRMVLPEASIICINLGRMLFFDVYFVEKNLPEDKCLLVNDLKLCVTQKASIVFMEAEHSQALSSLPVDLFINIASMQEMDIDVIRNYFRMMRSGNGGAGYFYCCNRVEKTLPDGSVIRFDAYPWEEKDEVVLDELCPWYQRFPVLQPPFWKAFDGPIRHRLVKLYKNGKR